MAPAAEARARISWGSIAWAGSGAARVIRPMTTRTMATIWNQGVWRSMVPSICQADFQPAKEMAPRPRAPLPRDDLEHRDRIDRGARHVLETEGGNRHQELTPGLGCLREQPEGCHRGHRARKCARMVLGQLGGGRLEVAGGHDVVAVENGPRLVAGDHHGHLLRDARVDQVADSGPTEVVDEL